VRAYRAVDPSPLGTLRITVSRPVVRARWVGDRIAPTIQRHVAQVQRAVHAARQLADIGREADLLANQLESNIVTILAQQVQSRADTTATDKLLQIDTRPIGRHTRAAVRDALERALLPAGLDVRADGAVQRSRRGRAAIVPADLVHPAVDGVDHDRCVLRCAAAGVCAFEGGQLRVDLGIVGAYLLGGGQAGKGEEGCEGGHCDGWGWYESKVGMSNGKDGRALMRSGYD
jgi:hypothetical protein